MKVYMGVHIEIHIFLTSALFGSEWSASRPSRFTPGTHWIGGWVGPRAGRDDVEKRKILTLLGLELHPSVVQPVVSRYTDCAIPAPSRPLTQIESLSRGSVLNIFLMNHFRR
jgi:hypothetical protein